MNLENIIVCAICLVAIAIAGYFMYTNVKTQNEEMLKLSKRFEAIEIMLAKPPSPDELYAMYRGQRNAAPPQREHAQPRDLHPPVHEHKERYERQQPRPCDSAMCDLEPLHIDTNEDELDNIVNAELNKVIEEDKAAKIGKHSSSKNSDDEGHASGAKGIL